MRLFQIAMTTRGSGGRYMADAPSIISLLFQLWPVTVFFVKPAPTEMIDALVLPNSQPQLVWGRHNMETFSALLTLI